MRGTIAKKIHASAAGMEANYDRFKIMMPKLRAGTKVRPYHRLCKLLIREMRKLHEPKINEKKVIGDIRTRNAKRARLLKRREKNASIH
jgi:hypothetical protein